MFLIGGTIIFKYSNLGTNDLGRVIKIKIEIEINQVRGIIRRLMNFEFSTFVIIFTGICFTISYLARKSLLV
jgi:hypothetical protein